MSDWYTPPSLTAHNHYTTGPGGTLNTYEAIYITIGINPEWDGIYALWHTPTNRMYRLAHGRATAHTALDFAARGNEETHGYPITDAWKHAHTVARSWQLATEGDPPT